MIGGMTMPPLINAGEGIEIIRINPIYSIDLKDTIRIKLWFSEGRHECKAHYIEIIVQNPNEVTFEFYQSKDNPTDTTIFTLKNVYSIDIERSLENSLNITAT